MTSLRTDGMDKDFVPSIDISAFLHDPDSPSARKTVEAVRRACITTGFFQISGHGLSDEVTKGVLQASQKFFALPMEEKMKLDARAQVGRRGYDVLESQTYHADVLPDLKEVSLNRAGNSL